MLDIGLSEITVIGVVALVVLGPERLPKVARTAGHLFGRLQRYVANVKADINREMEFSELAKMKDEVTSAAKSFEQSVNEQTTAFESEARAIEKTAAADSNIDSTVSSTSQAELIAKQEDGLPPSKVTAPMSLESTPPVNNTVVMSPLHPSESTLQSFDLGIEPPRRHLL